MLFARKVCEVCELERNTSHFSWFCHIFETVDLSIFNSLYFLLKNKATSPCFTLLFDFIYSHISFFMSLLIEVRVLFVFCERVGAIVKRFLIIKIKSNKINFMKRKNDIKFITV